MKRLFSFMMLLALVSAGVLSGCGNTTVPVVFTGSVIGIVVKDKNKEPVEGAKVSIGNRDFITKADGMFKFDGVSFDNNFEITVEYNGQIKPIKAMITEEAKKIKMINIGMVYLETSGTIYICGRIDGNIGYTVIKNEKDIKKCTLSNQDGEANSIFVSNNIVYTAGSENNLPCYWKNSIKTDLMPDYYKEKKYTGNASSVYVKNDNVYIASTLAAKPDSQMLYETPFYFINDKEHYKEITIQGLRTGTADSIYVNDSNDVYITTNIENNNFESYGYCFKNNEVKFKYSAGIQSTHSSNDTIYVLGLNDSSKPIYYKNDSLNFLSITNGFCNSIYAYKNNLYVAGNKKDSPNTLDTYPCYWIVSNTEVKCKQLSMGKGEAKKIFVKDDTIYIIGYYNKNGESINCCWIIRDDSTNCIELNNMSINNIYVTE